MSIALCHENVLPARGGAEMYVADLLRRLVRAGHSVRLYAAKWDAAALPSGLDIRPVTLSPGGRASRPWRFSAALATALDRDPPAVTVGFDKTLGVDVYYPLGGLHAGSAGGNLRKHFSPLWRNLAGLVQRCDGAHRSFAKLERQLLTGPNPPLLVVNSAMVRVDAVRYYGMDPASVRVVPNAIDPDRFDESDRSEVRAAVRGEWGVNDHEVVAAAVAMNYRLKGLEPLLRALALTPAMKLVVAGSPKVGAWRRLARRLGVENRVRFIGPAADVRRVFFGADLLAHPTFYDPCSLVVLEALACGLPVVTSRWNGAAELMSPPREGFVVDDPHDHQALAAALTMLMDAERRHECGRAARRAAAGWTFDHHVRQMLDIIGSGTRLAA